MSLSSSSRNAAGRILIQLWFWLHLVSLFALILQTSTPAQYFGKYSKTALLIIGAFVVTTPLVLLASRWLQKAFARLDLMPKLNPALAAIIYIGSFILIFGLWTISTGPTSSYIVIRMYLTVMVFIVALWSLEAFPLPVPKTTFRLDWLLLGGTIILVAVLSRYFPKLLWADEGLGTSLALSWAQHGKIAFPILYSVPYGTMYSLVELGLGIWYTLFGVTLATARFFMLLVGVAALGVTYLTARMLFSKQVSAIVTLLALLPILTLNYIRIDISAAFYVAVALYCFVRAEKKGQLWLHFVAGFAIAWAVDGQPTVYPITLAFTLAYAFEYARLLLEKRKFFVYRPFFYLFLGQAAGALGYVSFYTVLSSGEFLSHTAALLGLTTGLTGIHQSMVGLRFSGFGTELTDQISLTIHKVPLLVSAAALGGVVSLFRRTFINRTLVFVVLSSIVIFSISFTYFPNFYFFPILPLYMLLPSAAFAEVEKRLAENASNKNLHFIFAGLTALVIGASLGLLVNSLAGAESQSYEQALLVSNQIRLLVPKQEKFVCI